MRNLRRHGVDLTGVQIAVLGMKGTFKSAEHFYKAFDPSKDPRYFDNDWGTAQLDKYLEDK